MPKKIIKIKDPLEKILNLKIDLHSIKQPHNLLLQDKELEGKILRVKKEIKAFKDELSFKPNPNSKSILKTRPLSPEYRKACLEALAKKQILLIRLKKYVQIIKKLEKVK